MDLIDRQAAIDRAVSIPMFGRDVKMVAVSEIKNLPSAQPEQRWIPVSERLPEKSGNYLTSTFYHEVYCDYWNPYEGTWNRTEQILAWMSLPEPYREDGETDGCDS